MHEPLFGLHVGREVVVELGPQLVDIRSIGLDRLDNRLNSVSRCAWLSVMKW